MSRFAICSISSFGPYLRQNVAIAHVLGACVHEGIYVVQEVASFFHCGPPSILAAIAGAEVAEECHGRVDLRLVQRPSALFRVREKRSAVAVGVGVSVPTDLEGGVPLGKPADAKAEHLIVGFAHRAPPLEAPSARLALRGFRRTSFHQRRERVGAPPGGGAPSPAMSVAVCDGEPSEGRGLQRLDARRLLVAHDEGAVAQHLRSSHLARLRYVKCSVHVSLTSGQSTFSTVW